MEDDPDAKLMLRLKGGEDTALNEIMTRWQQTLVSFIYRYIGSQTDVLDLAQETFVRVFLHKHRYQPQGKFSTWLFTIASNLCRNHFRWQKRHATIALDAAESEGQSLADSLPSEGEGRPLILPSAVTWRGPCVSISILTS